MDEETFDETASERRWQWPADRRKKIWSGRLGSDNGTDDEILTALDAAVIVSRAGNRLQARQLCAAIIFESQHLIASRKMLLRAMLCALLAAHGFRLLSRFILASHGFSVRIRLLPDGTEQPRIHPERYQVRLVVNQRFLDEVSPDHLFLCELCDVLRRDRWRQCDYEA